MRWRVHHVANRRGLSALQNRQDRGTSYRIRLAVAGFGPGDLSIVAQENVLTISGGKNANQQPL